MIARSPIRRVLSAFEALDRAGVPYGFRKGSRAAGTPAVGAEIDIWLQPQDIRAADAVLHSAGFRRLRVAGAGDHRFYLAFEAGRWLKIDAKIAGARAARSRTSRFFPLSVRRLGPVIAILGPDGAGKGRIIAGLREQVPVGLTVMYLGWIPARRVDPALGSAPATEPRERSVGSLRESAFVAAHALRFLPRLVRSYVAAWKGYIVICDRHPVELLAINPRRTAMARKLEGALWRHLMPWPDAIVLLDAPGDVLHERKGEHSAELLERWRRSYLEIFSPRATAKISTTEPVDVSIACASGVLWEALRRRRHW